jgi:hypothetical protein
VNFALCSVANRAIINGLNRTDGSRRAEIKLLAGDITWAGKNKEAKVITAKEMVELNVHVSQHGIIEACTGTVEKLGTACEPPPRRC